MTIHWRQAWRKLVVTAGVGTLIGIGATPSARADYPNKVLDSSPVGFWRLNDTVTPERSVRNWSAAGETLDGFYQNGEAGVAAPGELGDGTLLPGIGFGNLAFDVGSNDSFIEVDSSLLSGLSEFTLSGWFNPRSYPAGFGGLVGQFGAVEFGFNGGSSLEVQTAGGGNLNWPLPNDDILKPGVWTHLAAVGTGTQLQLYVNGQQVATGGTPIGTSYGSSTAPLRIGSGVFAASGDQFEGGVDEIAVWGTALSAETIQSHFDAALGAVKRGDFNGNDRFDAGDINGLIRAVNEGSDDTIYDVTDDGLVDENDIDVWVKDIKLSFYGDANLDGEFNSSDLVFVFVTNEYEDGIPENSGWDDGDWNGDLEFTSADFVVAFGDGGFERGPAAHAGTAAVVPEPASYCLQFCLSAGGLLLLRRRH
ncbi:MAG: hypothetical protein KDA92_17525 [Planctomycetales bacterium]|nr:hypothetical protein [Planctomycetales bacterium]